MGPNCPFPWKWDFSWKLTNTTIVYLLRFIMLQCLKKAIRVGKIMRYKVSQFWVKLDTNHPFTNKGHFFEKLTNVNFICFMHPIKIIQQPFIWLKNFTCTQGFIQARLSAAAFPQRFSFLTVCLVPWLRRVAPWYKVNRKFEL